MSVSASFTDAGIGRERNEDRVLVDEARGLYCAVDGMGGPGGGDVAAEVALATLSGGLDGCPSEGRLRDAFLAANSRLIDESRVRGRAQPLGAVATVAWVDRSDWRVLIGHVGDTRAMLLGTDGSVVDLTVDATLHADHLLSDAEAARAVDLNVVTNDLGREPRTEGDVAGWLEISETRLMPGEVLAVCSDGVHKFLSRRALAAAAEGGRRSARGIARRIHAAALAAQRQAGNGDNLCAVIVRRPPLTVWGERTRRPGLDARAAGRLWVPRLACVTLLALAAVLCGLAWRDGSAGRTPATSMDAAASEGGSFAGPGPAIVAAGTVATWANLRPTGSAPGVVVVGPGATLLLEGVQWIDGTAELMVIVGKRATVSITTSRLELGELHFSFASGARLVIDRSRLGHTATRPLFDLLSDGSVVELREAELLSRAAGPFPPGMAAEELRPHVVVRGASRLVVVTTAGEGSCSVAPAVGVAAGIPGLEVRLASMIEEIP